MTAHLWSTHIRRLRAVAPSAPSSAAADDLALDVPDAASQLGLFVARAVVDDILPPAFIKTAEASTPLSPRKNFICFETLPAKVTSPPLGFFPPLAQMGLQGNHNVGREALRQAQSHLSARHASTFILNVWEDRTATNVDTAKIAIARVIAEYLAGGDVQEAARSVQALHVPFFCHELVKKALTAAIESEKATEARLARPPPTRPCSNRASVAPVARTGC